MPSPPVDRVCLGCGVGFKGPPKSKYHSKPCCSRNYSKSFKRGVKCGLCKKPMRWGRGEDGSPHPFDLDGRSHFTTCVFATKGRKRGSASLRFSEIQYKGSWIG